MCLYPRIIRNKKFTVTAKNNGDVPKCTDTRTLYVPVGCGKCIECTKQRARGWKIRLLEEIKQHKREHKHFITLTFSNEAIQQLILDIPGAETLEGYNLDNAIAKLAVRRFLERWRAKYGTSVRHWFVTELGHQGTENIHLHGIVFTDKPDEINELWGYGYTWKGTYVNEATVNYIIKYCTKIDQQHKYYNPKVLTSPGIGKSYIQSYNAKLHTYKPGTTNENYKNREGYKMNLPTYYRNHLFTEEQREKLWIEKLDKQQRYVLGTRIDISKGMEEYQKNLKWAQERNKRLGYGSDEINWSLRNYENQQRQMNLEKRLAKDLENPEEQN